MDDLGVTRALTEHSPAMIQHFLRDSSCRFWANRLAQKRDLPGWAYGCRASVDPARRRINPKSKVLTAAGKALVRAVTCDCVWTRRRAFYCGYVIDTMCQLCGEAEDTWKHRIFDCAAPEVVKARMTAITAKFLLHMTHHAPANPDLYLHGIVTIPAELPAPAASLDVTHKFAPPEVAGKHDSEKTVFGGPSFFDGSCARQPIKDVNRAAWAASFVDKTSRRATQRRIKTQGTRLKTCQRAHTQTPGTRQKRDRVPKNTQVHLSLLLQLGSTSSTEVPTSLQSTATSPLRNCKCLQLPTAQLPRTCQLPTAT